MLRLLITLAITGTLVFLIARSVDLSALIFELTHFNLWWLTALLPLSLLITLLKGWRFSILLHNSGIRIPLIRAIKIFIAGATTTSLPGGEATRVLLVRRLTGANTGQATSAVVAQAYFELLTAALMTLIGSFFFEIGFGAALISVGILLIVATIFIFDRAAILLASLLARSQKLRTLSARLLTTQLHIKDHLIDSKTHLPDKAAIRSFGIGVLCNILGGLLIFLICQAYNAPIQIFQAIFVFAAANLIQGMSITPAGLGFTEGGMTSILLLFGLQLPTVISIVLIYRATTFLFPTLLGSVLLFGYSAWPKRIHRLFKALKAKIPTPS